jgi:hypothetical protein
MLAVIAPLLTVGAAASAAPPSNDDINNATVIGSLPFRDVQDITEATFDFSTDSSACFGSDHSVWYTFTPASDERVAFDPSPSSPGEIAIDVFTGSPGALTFVTCGAGGAGGFDNSGVILNAAAGTTYWVMASTICCVSTPILDLSVYLAVAPQATINVTGGSADRGGNASITGTVNCVGTVPLGGRITGSVRQNVGRLGSVTATFAVTTTCATSLTWTALAQPSAGRFVGGPATVNAAVTFCNIVGCTTPSTTAVITLRK